MIKTEIVGGGSNKAAQVANTPFGSVLTTITPDKLYAHFKSATRTGAGTTIIVQPRSGEAIALTDFIISGEKKAGTLTLQFTDGTNTINIAVIPLVDAPANFAIPFVGRWMGWRDARISMITDVVANVTVSCGYVRVPSEHTLSYAEWDALR
jgi:hypothetical protein